MNSGSFEQSFSRLRFIFHLFLSAIFLAMGLLILGAVMRGSPSEQIYKKAQTGDARSAYEIGLGYLNGTQGFPKSEQTAFEWFMKSAEKGYPDAQYEVGLYYFQARPPVQQENQQKNFEEAFKWFKRSTHHSGYIPYQAVIMLGMMYAEGQGVEKNDQAAKHWLGISCRNHKVIVACEKLTEIQD